MFNSMMELLSAVTARSEDIFFFLNTCSLLWENKMREDKQSFSEEDEMTFFDENWLVGWLIDWLMDCLFFVVLWKFSFFYADFL
jgi:hypothetical protein